MGNGQNMNEIQLNLERFVCDKCGWIEDIEWTDNLKGKVQSFRCDKCGGTKHKEKDGLECQDEKLTSLVKHLVGHTNKSWNEPQSSSDPNSLRAEQENTPQQSSR
jgi:NAD-dependent SIR2 family protein deacetylase